MPPRTAVLAPASASGVLPPETATDVTVPGAGSPHHGESDARLSRAARVPRRECPASIALALRVGRFWNCLSFRGGVLRTTNRSPLEQLF
jgi:hypothetical protein